MSPTRHYRREFVLNQSGFLAYYALHPSMWHEINSPEDVPINRDVRIAVIDDKGTVHALVFPCRRVDDVWFDSKLQRRIEVYPTHWQEWKEDRQY